MNGLRQFSPVVFLVLLSAFCCVAQETKEAAKPMPPLARLQAAQTAFVRDVEGGSTAVDTITTTLEGWGRYKLVDDAKKADLLIEISSPDEDDGGVSVSSSTGPSRTGRTYEQSSSSSRNISSGSGVLRLAVRDAKTGLTLWGASQPVKGAYKKNARENNLVEAAQKLVSKFHDRVEPPDAKASQ